MRTWFCSAELQLGIFVFFKITWAPPASSPAVDHYVISARPSTENLYRARFVVPGAATTANVRIVEDLGIAIQDVRFPVVGQFPVRRLLGQVTADSQRRNRKVLG